MLRTLLSYAAGAFVVQLVTGLLTKGAELVVADTISRDGFGTYQHYMLVLEVAAGFGIIGIDHALITYINRKPENFGRFLRLFMTYVSILIPLFFAIALAVRPRVEIATVMALAIVGPYVLAELGKLVFRSRLDKKREFSFMILQSMTWSVGCLATIRYFPSDLTPVAWSLVGLGLVAVIMYFMFMTTARRETGVGAWSGRPFGGDYDEFWRSYRPLWIAGLAFHGNNHIVNILIDSSLGKAEFASWRFVFIMMMFIQRPLQLVQRATLPVFTRETADIPRGFRSLVRVNLIVFPLLALGVLALYPIILSFGTLGEKYGDTWIYLAIIISVSPVTAVEFLVATLSMAQGFPRNNRNAHVTALAFNVPASYFLITSYGLLGAACAVALYVLFFAGTIFWFTRRDLPEYVAFAIRHLASSLFCLAAAIALLGFSGHPVILAPVAVLIYIGGTRVFGLWEMRDISMVWGKLRQR